MHNLRSRSRSRKNQPSGNGVSHASSNSTCNTEAGIPAIPNSYSPIGIGILRSQTRQLSNNLQGVILQILGWVEDHLYEFKIKGRRYVNFGNAPRKKRSPGKKRAAL